VAISAFAVVTPNLFTLLLLAEAAWGGLYALAGIVGVTVDEAGCFGLTFLILGLASVELCIGLLMLINLRRLKVALSAQRGATPLSKSVWRSMAASLPTKRRV
jgi:hypothetical protein